jgi:hypothetical protein
MTLPKLVLRDRTIILLSGFKDAATEVSTSVSAIVANDEDKLHQAVKRNPDVVAIGHVAGEWVPAA